MFPQAIVQACVIHLIRATLRYASRKYWDQLAKDLRTIYTAPTVRGRVGRVRGARGEVGQALPGDPAAVAGGVGGVHPVPGLRRGDPPGPVLHERDRVAERSLPQGCGARGHFPTEQAALKTLYLVTRGMDPKGTGQARWITRWKPALNAFAITFADRNGAAAA